MRFRDVAIAIGASAAAACTTDPPVVGDSERLAISMVISRAPSSSDSALYALVYGASTTGQSRYRTIEQVELRRRSDGALFAWEAMPRSGAFDLSDIMQPTGLVANLRLPWNGDLAGLGRADLQAGETYDLLIVTEGRTITGSTTLPAVPMVEEQPGEPLAFSWDPVPYAFAYAVQSDVEMAGLVIAPTNGFQHARVKPIDAWPSPAWLRVSALDSNLAWFWTEQGRQAAGVSGAVGVFGSLALDSIVIAPPSALVRGR